MNNILSYYGVIIIDSPTNFTHLYINTSTLFKEHTLHLLLHIKFIHCI